MKSPGTRAMYLVALTLMLISVVYWFVTRNHFPNATPPAVSAGKGAVPALAEQPKPDAADSLAQAVAPLSKPDKLSKTSISASYGKLPLSFEANHGQANSQVKFLARGNGYHLSLTATEAVLTLGKSAASEALRMKLASANPAAQVEGLEELPGRSNYFIGNDPNQWRTNVPHYARVKYREVYPGVDLIYYGNQRQLEYDLVVAPGADPDVITLAFEGAKKLRIDANGDLVSRTASGEIRQHKPVIYQEVEGVRQTIAGRYVPKGKDQIGFEVSSYDESKPLVIDPVLSYSTYLGGAQLDQGLGIAVDSAGNAYVTGVTNSTNFPLKNPVQPAFGGGSCGITFCSDVFVTKLNATGTALVYSTYLGGDLRDDGLGIAVDSVGNACVTGLTTSSNFPITPGAFQTTKQSGGSPFVAKLNATGTALIYSTYLGSGGRGLGIAVDSAGNAYVTGDTTSASFPTTPGAFQTTGDAFVTKLNTTGTALIYSTYLGGLQSETCDGIAVDAAGNAYITGYTSSTNFPTKLPVQATYGGGSDAFVTKLNPTGTALVYSTYLGGSGFDFGYSIAVDSVGNAYVTGETISTNFPVTPNAFQRTLSGAVPSREAFVTKLNASGTAFFYSTYLGGDSVDQGFGIATDDDGNAYVTGRTLSDNFPVTPNALQSVKGEFYDVFLTKFDPLGDPASSTYLGGNSSDEGRAIAVDATGNAYVTGITSANFPTTGGAFQTTASSNTNAFVAKISDNPTCTVTCTATVPATSTTGTPVSFAATATSPGCTGTPTYDWDFGDGRAHSSQQNPTHSYATAKAYTWTLTVRAPGATACVKTGTITVTASSCVLNCSANVSSGGIAKFPVSFIASHKLAGCTASVAYDWDFGDSTAHSSTQNITHTYTNPGMYTWTLTVRANGANTCVTTGEVTVEPNILLGERNLWIYSADPTLTFQSEAADKLRGFIIVLEKMRVTTSPPRFQYRFYVLSENEKELDSLLLTMVIGENVDIFPQSLFTFTLSDVPGKGILQRILLRDDSGWEDLSVKQANIEFNDVLINRMKDLLGFIPYVGDTFDIFDGFNEVLALHRGSKNIFPTTSFSRRLEDVNHYDAHNFTALKMRPSLNLHLIYGIRFDAIIDETNGRPIFFLRAKNYDSTYIGFELGANRRKPAKIERQE